MKEEKKDIEEKNNFIPSKKLKAKKINQNPSIENSQDLGRCVVFSKQGTCNCWDNVTYDTCVKKIENWVRENPDQYHSSDWVEGEECEDIVQPNCTEGD